MSRRTQNIKEKLIEEELKKYENTKIKEIDKFTLH